MLHLTSNPFEWPIIAYMILAGTSAGLALVGGAAALSSKSNLASIARQSLLLATLFIGVGFPLLILDLEQPQMFVYILYYFNPKSVIAWGARGISLYFFLLSSLVLVHRVCGPLRARAKEQAMALRITRQAMLIVVLVLAVFVGLYPGFVLNQAAARPLWSQSVLPFLFLSSGLHMGLAIAILARLWSAGDPNFVPEPSDPLLHDHPWVRRLDVALIALQVLLLTSYFYSCMQIAPDATTQLTQGKSGLLLWGGVILVGWILPGLDMAVRGAKSSLFWRSTCVVAGGICLRVLIIEGGQGAAAFIGSGR